MWEPPNKDLSPCPVCPSASTPIRTNHEGKKMFNFCCSSIGTYFPNPVWTCKGLLLFVILAQSIMRFVIPKGWVETVTGALVPWCDLRNHFWRLSAGRCCQEPIPSSSELLTEEPCGLFQWLLPAPVELWRAFSSYLEIIL